MQMCLEGETGMLQVFKGHDATHNCQILGIAFLGLWKHSLVITIEIAVHQTYFTEIARFLSCLSKVQDGAPVSSSNPQLP